MEIQSKLPRVGTTIFSVMSAMAIEHGAINLSQGFPNFDCPDELKDRVNFHMREGRNQYAPMPGVPLLRERIAEKAGRLYGRKPDKEGEITITAGATQALFCALTAFVRPGDEVIIMEPAYDSYRPVIQLNGGVPVVYRLQAPDFRVDWDGVTALVTERTRMIVINNPHNPTGRILSAADIVRLEDLTKGTDILVLSDEVYEHLVFDGRTHQSVLRSDSLAKRSLVTFSFGKTFHNTGWKVGYCIAPPHLMAEFRKVHQYNVFSVITPVQFALADYLYEPAHYRGLSGFYQKKRDYFLESMKGSRFRPVPCEGTYFQLFDYREISDLPDQDFARELITEHGVAAIPVSAFNDDGRDDRLLRFCFAKTEDTLAQSASLLRGI